MKRAIFGLVVIALLFSTSCNKSNNTLETWSFEGTNYNATSVSGQTGVLVATNIGALNPSSYVQVSCFFLHDSLPTVAGSYTVVSGTPAAKQVALSLSLNAGTKVYNSTGGNGTQTVAVSISGGKVTVIGSNITLAATSGTPVDSSATFSLNITQQ